MKRYLKLSSSNLISLAGLAIVIYLLVVLGQAVYHNYQLQNQIDSLHGQITNLSNQRDELSYNLQFYQTDSFNDREARAKLGLQKPGESVIILPHPSDIAAAQAAALPKPKPKSNFQQWVDFLAGHS